MEGRATLGMEIREFEARAFRLIATRWPTVGVFDDLVSANDALAAMELEGATNDRLTGALGRLDAIPREEWALGSQGAFLVMAAFMHPAPPGGRFNSPALGAWYASLDIETAIEETLYHNTRRLRASDDGFPNRIQMRELVSSPKAQLLDIRGLAEEMPDLYDPDSYSGSQVFGEERRSQGSDGIWFDSVRRAESENIVIFKPKLVPPVLQGDHFEYVWDTYGAHTISRLTNVA